MLDPSQPDLIDGPLDESEEAVAAVNALAEKNDDPDMQVRRSVIRPSPSHRSSLQQMSEIVNVQLKDDSYNCFNDGITKIGQRFSKSARERGRLSCTFSPLDFMLVYEDKHATTVDQLMISLPPAANNDENERIALALQKQKDRHRLYKRRYLTNLSRLGLLMETVTDPRLVTNGRTFSFQDVREGDRSLVYFVKVHLPWPLMLKYAEELNFRVPIRVYLFVLVSRRGRCPCL